MIRHPRGFRIPSHPTGRNAHGHLRRGATTLATFLACAGLLAACSSSTAASKAKLKPTTPTPAAGPIKIGIITSLTGPFAPLGTNDQLGAKMAVAQVNAAGGINGRKIDLIIENDQTDPTQAILDYQTLISDGVVGVVGPVFSSSALALLGPADRAKVPTIMTSPTDSAVQPTRPYVFMTPPLTSLWAEQELAYMKYKGLTSTSVMNMTDVFSVAGWQDTQKLAPHYGIRIAGEQSFTPTTAAFTAPLTHVKNIGAKALMVWGAGPGIVALTQQFNSMGLTMPLVFSGAEASFLYLQPVGAAGNGKIIAASIGEVGPYLPAGPLKTEVMSFVNAFEAANHYYPPEFAMDAYSAVELLATAMHKATTITPAAIDTALNHTSLLTPMGTFNYTPSDHAGLSLNDIVITTDENGTLTPTHFTLKQLGAS